MNTLAAAAEDQGCAVKLSSLADYKPSTLKRECGLHDMEFGKAAEA